MTLSIKDKEDWKKKVENRFDAEIERIKAVAPNVFVDIEEKTEGITAAQLGFDLPYYVSKNIKQEIEKLQDELESLEHQMAQAFLEIVPEIQRGCSSVKEIIKRGMAYFRPLHEQNLMNSSKAGSQIIQLRQEKETLLEEIRVATSSTRLKRLWIQANKLLDAISNDSQLISAKQKQ